MSTRPLAAAIAALVLPGSALPTWGLSALPKGVQLKVHPSGHLQASAAVAPVLQAGHPNPKAVGATKIAPDSPGRRVDPNTTTSLFAGVGSIFAGGTETGGSLCTATPISSTAVITAAHCLDLVGDDGQLDVLPEDVYFNLNFGGDLTHSFQAKSVTLHPDFDGFSPSSVSDDLAVVKLSRPLPKGVPIYSMAPGGSPELSLVLMAGYGISGDGVNGYYVEADPSVKRFGGNIIEYAEGDDEGSGLPEVVAWDFEFSQTVLEDDYFGVPYALPNWLESTLGGGDSGGPSFLVGPDGRLFLAAVNTFTWVDKAAPGHDLEGYFGSGSGGVWLNWKYQEWVWTTVPDHLPGWAGLGSLTAALFALQWWRSRRPA